MCKAYKIMISTIDYLFNPHGVIYSINSKYSNDIYLIAV